MPKIRTASPRLTTLSLVASCRSWRCKLRSTATSRRCCANSVRPWRYRRNPFGRFWAHPRAWTPTFGRSGNLRYMSRSTRTQVATENPLSRRGFLSASLGVGVAALSSTLVPIFSVGAPQASPRIETTDLPGGLKLLQGACCNVIAMHGDDGALMVDGGLRANADALLTAVRAATGNSRINTLINTHWHPEQTGANEAVGRDGGVILAHENTRMYLSNTVSSVTFGGRRRSE